jgi:hypothetical protein
MQSWRAAACLKPKQSPEEREPTNLRAAARHLALRPTA